jgi:hypothetical protein
MSDLLSRFGQPREVHRPRRGTCSYITAGQDPKGEIVAVIVIVYLLAWVPLVAAGRRLGRRWGNPDAGFWLPVLLGGLGFAMFIAVAVTDGDLR